MFEKVINKDKSFNRIAYFNTFLEFNISKIFKIILNAYFIMSVIKNIQKLLS
jgi:hypothetical protein